MYLIHETIFMTDRDRERDRDRQTDREVHSVFLFHFLKDRFMINGQDEIRKKVDL